MASLSVMELSRLLRYDDIEAHLNSPPKPVVVSDAFPSDEWHGWKFIRFGPDGKLYVPVGAPCYVGFTDNGRDYPGENIPPDELNFAPRPGMNFGFPYVHGKNISDAEFGAGHNAIASYGALLASDDKAGAIYHISYQ